MLTAIRVLLYIIITLFSVFAILLKIFPALMAMEGDSQNNIIIRGVEFLSAYNTAILLTAISILSIVIMISIAWRLTVSVSRFVSGVGSTYSGSEILSVTIAILLSLLFYRDVVINLYQYILSSIEVFFVDIPWLFIRLMTEASSCIGNDPDRVNIDCTQSFVFNASSQIAGVVSRLTLGSALRAINPIDIVAMIGIAVGLSYFLLRALPSYSSTQRLWGGYIGLAVGAIYLALSATLAVPLLKRGIAVEEISPKNLRESLESAQLGVKSLAIVSAGGDNPKGDASEKIFVITKQETVIPPGLVAEMEYYGTRMQDDFDRLSDQSEKLRGEIDRYSGALIEAAVTQYEIESRLRVGERESSQHFREIVLWYSQEVDRKATAIAECDAGIGRIRESARGIVIEFNSLQSIYSSTSGSTVNSLTELDYKNFDEFGRLVRSKSRDANDSISDCAVSASAGGIQNLPVRSSYGSSLGLVGTATRWLLSAESLAVVLIVGLIGYGLLGALVSRFARSNSVGDKELSVSGLLTVGFSGFVAALIVYVAAYGGLAIAAVGTTEPNAYVVFGACLVGAVYGEEVWRRARLAFFPDDKEPDVRPQGPVPAQNLASHAQGDSAAAAAGARDAEAGPRSDEQVATPDGDQTSASADNPKRERRET